MSNSRDEALYLKNNINKTKTSAEITTIASSVGFSFFYANSFAIVMLTKEILNFVMLAGFNLFFFLPASVVVSSIQAALAFREAKLKGWKVHPAIRFGIELTSAVAISASVAGTFLTQFALWETLPFVFTAVLGIKSLYQLGAGVYSTAKAFFIKDSETARKKHLTKAVEHYLNSASSMCMAAGTLLLYVSLFSAAPILATIGGACGVVGGLVAAGIGLHKLRKLQKEKKRAEFEALFARAREIAQAGLPLTSRALMAKRLGNTGVREEGGMQKENVDRVMIERKEEPREEETKSLENGEERVSFRLR